MKRQQFSDWLKARGVTQLAHNTRIHAVGRIEKVMQDLGSPYSDLDEAYDADQLDGLRSSISDLSKDLSDGGESFRVLLPDATKPQSRISNFRAWLGQYRQFREAGDAPLKRSNWTALEVMRDEFLLRVPDFRSFVERDGVYFDVERSYKDGMLAQFREVLATGGDAKSVGRAVYKLLLPNSGPLLRWQTADSIEKKFLEYADEFYRVIGELSKSTDDVETEISRATSALEALKKQGVQPLTPGEILSITISVAGFAHPEKAAPFKVMKGQDLAIRLKGKSIFSEKGLSTDEQVEQWLDLLREIFAIMKDVWDWHPQDLFDVQGFAWVVLDKAWTSEDQDYHEEQALPMERAASRPTNLILYGPPGTGKTFATAEEAVRLCDGSVPLGREAIRKRYQSLKQAGQIAFVTFHQSYAYEDFVEGLRPVTPEADGQVGGGFSLIARPGIFREICALAEQARTRSKTASPFDLTGRTVFKMSLGRAGIQDHVYNSAIAGDYVILGWGGNHDWSDAKYESFDAIRERWNEIEPGTSGKSGNIAQSWCFRSSMKVGDIVVISDGNSRFRAIGEVTGPYQYEPNGENTYNHRRKVKWRLVLDEPLPVETISTKLFSMTSCYQLDDRNLKKEALARLLSTLPTYEDNGGQVDQFVLVVDEINRANISKVFGELITLIEPDKRLGSENPISVRLPYSGEEFGVPDNLHIVGTMNTADRSIALLDTALRRRFDFRELMPHPELLEAARDRSEVDLVLLLSTINARIEYLFDREHQIGHAYFFNCATKADVDDVMRYKVIPLLAEYFYEDWSKVATVLGDTSETTRFLDRVELKPPADLVDQGAETRIKWVVKSQFADDVYDALT